jgi:hypothetical protein
VRGNASDAGDAGGDSYRADRVCGRYRPRRSRHRDESGAACWQHYRIHYLEQTLGAKWLELLKEIAPSVKRVALMFNPESSPYSRLFFQSMERAMSKLAVEAFIAAVRSPSDIEQAMTKLGAKRVVV